MEIDTPEISKLLMNAHSSGPFGFKPQKGARICLTAPMHPARRRQHAFLTTLMILIGDFAGQARLGHSSAREEYDST